MPHRIERLRLPPASLGTQREIVVHRFGRPGARPQAYFQAALHANELPGQLVAHHLIRRLRAADDREAIGGEIVVVPVANPIGLGQVVLGRQVGRFELDSGTNFNRGYPDLAAAAAELAGPRLGADAAANTAALRAAMAEALAALVPANELDGLRLALMRLAIGADIVLDLHCDNEAELHVYMMGGAFEPAGRELAAELGATAALLARQSGGRPFDEAFGGAWAALAERLGPARPVAADACFSATVELRGTSDVDDALADADAAALMRFLQRRGVVAGDPGPLPGPRCAATPLEGVDVIRSPVPGVIVYRRPVGAVVEPGEVVAEVVDPAAADPEAARTALRSRTRGRLFARSRPRLARPGAVVAKIAGSEPLAERTGNLLDP
jgi:hypothetical protein